MAPVESQMTFVRIKSTVEDANVKFRMSNSSIKSHSYCKKTKIDKEKKQTNKQKKKTLKLKYIVELYHQVDSFIFADVYCGAGDIFRENTGNRNEASEAVNHNALANCHILVKIVPYDH